MKMLIVETCALAMQNWMFQTVQENAMKHPCLTLGASVWVALADTAIDTLKLPLAAIEGLALAIINLLGVLLCADGWTLKGALLNAEKTGTYAARIPGAILLAPFKFVYQTIQIINDPMDARSLYQRERFLSTADSCDKYPDKQVFYLRAY